jgi:hypothetical protein
MIRRTLPIGALIGFLSVCAAANDPSQWPARYHKQGVTSQQLTDDGAACLGASPNPWTATAVWVGGPGGPAPLATQSRMVDLDPFAECMKTKGYTVTP